MVSLVEKPSLFLPGRTWKVLTQAATSGLLKAQTPLSPLQARGAVCSGTRLWTSPRLRQSRPRQPPRLSPERAEYTWAVLVLLRLIEAASYAVFVSTRTTRFSDSGLLLVRSAPGPLAILTLSETVQLSRDSLQCPGLVIRRPESCECGECNKRDRESFLRDVFPCAKCKAFATRRERDRKKLKRRGAERGRQGEREIGRLRGEGGVRGWREREREREREVY